MYLRRRGITGFTGTCFMQHFRWFKPHITQWQRKAIMAKESWNPRSFSVGPSDEFREPSLEPKHKIFLSHSGAQKNFTEQLCKDLERVHHFPFFDKRPDSLPKGEKFPPLIIKAAKQCRVAILVLSEEFFTRSKWPMIELNEFVKAQASTNTRLKILPLFLGITREQTDDAERLQSWVEKWEGFEAKDDRIDVNEWVHASAKILSAINAMEYNGVEGHVTYREKVVAAVCKLVRPNLEWDVSHVQGMECLCQPILRKLEEIKPSSKYRCGVRVVGLYGMGGVGKTTISKAICNQKFGDLDGKACHVELGDKNLVELRKIVLRELTEASPEILTNEAGKLADLLKSRMHRQRVFLILDNVWDYQIEEARMYLETGYHDGSIVLVTSRSLDTLVQLHIRECDCLEMPELEDECATKLFLYYTERSCELSFDENDRKIIKRCLKECRFLKGKKSGSRHQLGAYHYLPLALKALGTQLGSISHEPQRWEESLKKLKADKFNMRKDNIHPVFSVLRLGYDALCLEEQHIFLDLALLLVPQNDDYERRYWEQLCIIYKKTLDDIKESLKVLRRKGLLGEVSASNDLEVKIHDLYLDFAKAEAQAGPFEGRRFLLLEEGTDVPRELLKNPPGLCWPCLERLIIHKSKVRSLKNAKLHLCSNVEVLQLFDCEQLEEIDVKGMDSLITIEVTGCDKLGPKFEGVEKLSNLVWLCWNDLRHPAPGLHNLSLLTALQVLEVRGDLSDNGLVSPPNLSGCINLRKLTLSRHGNLKSFPDVSNLTKLETMDFSECITASLQPNLGSLPESLLKIDISYCRFAGSSWIDSMSSLTSLQELNLQRCWELNDVKCLCRLISLQKINASYTNISELPDLRKLKQLEFMDVSGCRSLRRLAGIRPSQPLAFKNGMCISSTVKILYRNTCTTAPLIFNNYRSLGTSSILQKRTLIYFTFENSSPEQ